MKELIRLTVLPWTIVGHIVGIIFLLLGGDVQIGEEGTTEYRIPKWMMKWAGKWRGWTCGYVIIFRDFEDSTRWREHELQHVRQFEKWGIVFPYVYWAAGLWQMCKGKSFYWDNPFEVEAREVGGR